MVKTHPRNFVNMKTERHAPTLRNVYLSFRSIYLSLVSVSSFSLVSGSSCVDCKAVCGPWWNSARGRNIIKLSTEQVDVYSGVHFESLHRTPSVLK